MLLSDKIGPCGHAAVLRALLKNTAKWGLIAEADWGNFAVGIVSD